jgi:hypothetical protein
MDIQLTEAEKIKILTSDDIYSIMQKILLREQKIDQDREHFWIILWKSLVLPCKNELYKSCFVTIIQAAN